MRPPGAATRACGVAGRKFSRSYAAAGLSRPPDDPNYVADLLSIIDRVMRLMDLLSNTTV
jgi:hypothetical protein